MLVVSTLNNIRKGSACSLCSTSCLLSLGHAILTSREDSVSPALNVCVRQELHSSSPVVLPVSLVLLQTKVLVCTVWRLTTLAQWINKYAALYGTQTFITYARKDPLGGHYVKSD
jgi:hypothetical protein